MNRLLNEYLYSILSEAPSKAAAAAKKAGLVHLGYGYWGPAKEKPASHKTDDFGNLVPLSKQEKQQAQQKIQKQQSTAAPAKSAPAAGGKPAAPAVKPPKAVPDVIPSLGIKKDTERLREALELSKSKPRDMQRRIKLLTDLWGAFLNAPDYKSRVKAVAAMAEYNLIEAHAGGKKIYMSANTGLPYKIMCGTGGTAITRLMNDIITQNNISAPVRGGSKDRALADAAGKHNEAGVVRYLFPSAKNKQDYAKISSTYETLGGDSRKLDAANKNAAAVVANALPEGSKILNAVQVGAIGSIALKSMGINPKNDPTDLIVTYAYNGRQNLLKISAKNYVNPKSILMKNAGVATAGRDYIGGEAGAKLDALWGALKSKYSWNSTTPDEEKAVAKGRLRQDYLSTLSIQMATMAKTPEGQAQLLNMWRSVHGCGTNVYTLITNKGTGEVHMQSPNHYCNPVTPFKVHYDGVKVNVNMNTESEQFMEISMKTEDTKSPILIFRHRSK